MNGLGMELLGLTGKISDNRLPLNDFVFLT